MRLEQDVISREWTVVHRGVWDLNSPREWRYICTPAGRHRCRAKVIWEMSVCKQLNGNSQLICHGLDPRGRVGPAHWATEHRFGLLGRKGDCENDT